MTSKLLKYIYIEFRTRIRSIIIWSIIWIALAALIAWMYTPIRDQGGFNEFIESFDPTLLEAFNISPDYLSKAETFLSGEFLTSLFLIGAIYSSVIGVNSLGGKITDKTIINVFTKKISRPYIYLAESIVNLLSNLLSNLLIGIGTFISFSLILDESISIQFILNAFIAVFLIMLFFSQLGQLLGITLNKGTSVGVTAGIASIGWLLDSLKNLEDYPDILKPLTPYYYFNSDRLAQEYTLDMKITVLVVFSIIFAALGVYYFRRKNVYI
jgi:ABC-type transport system involved in multi-copper enzyme maturation permease subunit